MNTNKIVGGIINLQSVQITNKMKPCNWIYYSKVYWNINMFQAAYRSLSRSLNCICSLCKYSLQLLMMSGMPLKTCWAFNKCWNYKFYYRVASCWLFLL